MATDTTTETTTNPIVIENAQEPEKLDLNKLTLLGIFTKPDGSTALIRMANGQIASVTPGDTTGDMTVTALDDNALYLSDRRGRQVVLEMPKG